MTSKRSTKPQQIVIIGGGFAGIRTALHLSTLIDQTKGVIRLIDRESHHVYSPSLYEIVTGAHPKQVCVPIEECLLGTGIDFLQATVMDIRPKTREIILKDGQKLNYDHVVLAGGTIPNFYNIKGVKEYAFPLKSVQDAWILRQHIEDECQAAAQATAKEQSRDLNFVIVGAGPTGVELAGSLAEYRLQLIDRYELPAKRFRIELVEAGPEILGRAQLKTIQAARRKLQQLGVIITTNNSIQAEHLHTVSLQSGTRQTETLIWTAGVQPNALIKRIRGLTLDKRGFVTVDGYLRAVDFETMWVIGDCASVSDAGTVSAALHHAVAVAENIAASLHSDPLTPYEPQSSRLMLPIGARFAVIQQGTRVYSGLVGMFVKRWADLRYFFSILSPVKALKVWFAHFAACPECHRRLTSMLWQNNRV